jgi:hypothetical protein
LSCLLIEWPGAVTPLGVAGVGTARGFVCRENCKIRTIESTGQRFNGLYCIPRSGIA